MLLVTFSTLAVNAYQRSPPARPRAAAVRASVTAVAGERLATGMQMAEGIDVRVASRDELDLVARLQLDVFVPFAQKPVLLPVLNGLFEANQRSVRVGMRRRLCDDIGTRVDKGSDILVAAVAADQAPPLPDQGGLDGFYSEADVRLLGTVDISVQEMDLPTHLLSDGLYLSHMAVDPAFRRLGLGVKLLTAAEDAARSRGAQGIYLHVERSNAGARKLYEQCGYLQRPENAVNLGFTTALKVMHRDVVLLYKEVDG